MLMVDGQLGDSNNFSNSIYVDLSPSLFMTMVIYHICRSSYCALDYKYITYNI